MKVISESEEEEDSKRVILTEKEKKFGKLNEVYKKLQKCKDADWVSINKEFDEMSKQHSKLDKLIKKEGQPECYMMALIEISDKLETVTNNEKQKYSKNNNTAYNTLKQRIKKTVKQFTQEIEKMKVKKIEEQKVIQQQ